MFRLGSLFSGSGGFELAGIMNGVKPVWAAEIEPYPIRVTKARFPQMKHLGSVLDVNGAEVEPVDIITFGSPCQDLSVAGLRSGIHTEGGRSNLFFEAIRIIKEMRRSTDGIYPRIAVWENVPGAYSSNKGEDFRAVLQAFCSVKDETADVPRPAAGKWNPAGAIVGNGWSIAWRTFDAQYWGVPQRRRRIYLIADFGSERAGEILFKQEGLRGHSAESGTAGQGAAGDAEGGVGRGVLFEPMSALEENWAESSVKNALRAGASKSSHAVCYAVDGYNQSTSETAGTIRAGKSDQDHVGAVCYPIMFKERAGCPGGGKGILCGDKPFTLSTLTDQAVCYAVRTRNTMANGWGVAENAYTLDTSEGQAVAYSVDSVCYAIDRASFNQGINAKYDICIEPELNSPLVARGPSAVCYPVENHPNDSRVSIREDGIVPTLSSRMGTGGNNGPMVLEAYSAGNGQLHQALEYEKARPLDCMHDQQIVLHPAKPPRKYIIRRLTPLECCRLQGFPDWWEDGVQGSDSARYKMWGNGIALPNAEYVVGCAKKLIEGKHHGQGQGQAGHEG